MPAALAQAHRRKVFLAADERQADEAATLARLLGFDNVAVLAGGLTHFRSTILEAPPLESATTGDEAEVQAFRADAGRRIAALIKASAGARTVEHKPKKIVGGCGV